MTIKLDLKPYGIQFVLQPGKNNISDLDVEHVLAARFEGSNRKKVKPTDSFVINNVKYTVVKTLGSGSFGTTYQVKGPDDKDYALKQVKYTPDIFNEIVQQIIIVNLTRNTEIGSFAPILYTVGYDSTHNDVLIVSELMDDTVWNLIMSQTREQNDSTIPQILEQIAAKLDILQKKLNYNHRDLKTNNVMYTINPDGTLNVKLIDFGFSCMTWHGIGINAGAEVGVHFSKCNRPSRDISQFITSILFFHKRVISAKLKKQLGFHIQVDYRGKTRRAVNLMTKWTKSYKLFNRNNIILEHGTPTIIYDDMKRFTVKKKAPIAAHVACPHDKIMNPTTGRCVLRTGAIGRKLEKEMRVVPATSATVSEGAPTPPDDGCPPGKIRNPKTRRCVKKDGAVAKKLGLL